MAAPAQQPRSPAEDKITINALNQSYRNFLEGIYARIPAHYAHPGLNCRYGIELEFLASRNRYVIGNRVNSCMWKQNSVWWGRNFNALHPIHQNLPSGPKQITNGPSFDEYSSFFVEVTQEHGGVSHKGDHRCEQNGNAGLRIENDTSVLLDNNGPGITLWSLKKPMNFMETDLRDAAAPAWGPLARGLRHDICISEYNTPDNTCADFKLRPGNRWNVGGDTEFILNDQNEFVSNVLTNANVMYPHGNNPVGPKLLPLGSLLLDNVFNHMKAHTIVLATQRMGFHLHLSEFPMPAMPAMPAMLAIPAIPAVDENRKSMIVGFIKLFWAFEPLLFSFHPSYRSRSDWCQSLQSIFTFQEIKGLAANNYNRNVIWNDLMGDDNWADTSPISGTSRKVRGGQYMGQRYVGLNIQNCRPGGIGTIEARIGHSSFSSDFVQAYINVLQNLFQLNRALIAYDSTTPGRRLYQSHTWILNFLNDTNAIPSYTRFTPEQYNTMPPHDTNYNLPVAGVNPVHHGFFWGVGDPARCGRILTKQIQVFYALTNSIDPFRILIPWINFYHDGTTNSWNNSKQLITTLNFNDIFASMNAFIERPTMADGIHPANNWNSFKSVLLGSDYFINANNQNDLNNPCKTCSQNPAGQCAPDYNNGYYPYIQGNSRQFLNQSTDEHNIYTETCAGRQLKFKTQTELIKAKTGLNGAHNYRGGYRKKTRKQRQIKLKGGRRNTNNTNNSTRKINMNINSNNNMTKNTQTTTNDPFEYYRANQGAASIILREMKGKLEAAYTDWMGGLTVNSALTTIVNTLLNRNIVSKKQLHTLCDNRYIDFYIFLMDQHYHKSALIKELAKFKIDESKIEEIRAVYTEITTQTQSSTPMPTTINQDISHSIINSARNMNTKKRGNNINQNMGAANIIV